MGGSSGSGEARRARQTEEARQKRIEAGTKQIRNEFAIKFDEPYFQNLKKTASDYYMGGTPEKHDTTGLLGQYDAALKQMKYALMRTGNWNSTAAVNKTNNATDAYDKAVAAVGQQVQGLVNNRRGDISNAESNTVNQLIASGDSSAAAAQAANQMNIQSQPLQIPPLGQLFTDLTAGLATQADLERSGQNKYNVFGYSPYASSRYTTTVR